MTSRPVLGILALVLSGGAFSLVLSDDCNQNGIEDPEDIRSGVSRDCNRNSLPDECDVGEVVPRFASSPTLLSGGSFGRPLVSDLNGDGRPDIAALDNTGAGLLTIFRNRADGVLEALAPLTVPGAANHPVAADFDGDGDVDFAVPAPTPGSVELLLQEAPGVFGTRISFRTDGDAPIALAAGDMDGDLDPDLAVEAVSNCAPHCNVLLILLNAGGGVFVEGSRIATRATTGRVSMVDMDGDGDLDLTVVEGFPLSVKLHLNDGKGVFSLADGFIPVPAHQIQLAFADLDSDGDTDAAQKGGPGGDLTIHWNRVERGGPFETLPLFRGLGPLEVVAADLNDDGLMDLAGTAAGRSQCAYAAGTLWTSLNRGGGQFALPVETRVPNGPHALSAADFDLDGLPDLAGLTSSPFGILVYPGSRQARDSDCNSNGIPDDCDLAGNDCNSNGIPDSCELLNDCNSNGIPDGCERDCDANGIPDSCDVARDPASDCDRNGFPDSCDLVLEDRNRNGIPDACDVASGTSLDCNQDGVPDEAEILPILRLDVPPSLGELPFIQSLAAVDADLDGDLDLVAASIEWEGLVLFRREGSSIAPPVKMASVQDPRHVLAVDLDGGGTDLVVLSGTVGCAREASLLVFSGERGGFSAPRIHFGLTDPSSTVALDLDRDGDMDLAVADAGALPRRLRTFRNVGGLLEPLEGAAADLPLAQVAAGDVDGDGDVDIAALGTTSQFMSFFSNQGDGTISGEKRFDLPFFATSYALADIDQDRDLDIVAGGFGGGGDAAVWLLRGAGGGVFSNPELLEEELWPTRVFLDDVDGDGDLDLASIGTGSTGLSIANTAFLSVLQNLGAGRFGKPRRYTLGGRNPGSAVAADLDQDGRVEIVAFIDEGKLSVLENHGDGSFRAFEPLTYPSRGFKSATAADLDGDGDVDIAAGGSGPGAFQVFLNSGEGNLSPAAEFQVSDNLLLIDSEDLDGDGRQDIVTADLGGLQLLWNESSGEFAVGPFLPTAQPPVGVKLLDLDRDGDRDIAVATSNAVVTFLQSTARAFAEGQKVPVGSGPVALAAADFDGDGDVDLATGNSVGAVSDNFSVFLNQGDGRLVLRGNFAIDLGTTSVAAGDVDGDGDADLVVGSSFWTGTALLSRGLIFLNRGDASFVPGAEVELCSFIRSVLLVDVSGDGRLDIATGCEFGASVVEGRGDGTFGRPVLIGLSTDDGVLLVEDMDGDGDRDLVLAYLDDDDLDGILVVRNESGPGSFDGNGNGIPDPCEPGAGVDFRRGDATADGSTNLTDVIVILEHLFRGGSPLPCGKAADMNDDGRLDITDPIFLLGHLFEGKAKPAEPFVRCGQDPLPDDLGCSEFPACAF